jgi:D-alanine-D-alanine ligase
MVYAIVFGFNSDEHAVSLKTAYSMYKELSAAGYELLCVGGTKSGVWRYSSDIDTIIMNPDDIKTICINDSCPTVHQIGNGMINGKNIKKVLLATLGKYGEDGHIQGFLTMNKLPYTGCGVTGSSVGFNKYISKIIAQTYGVPIVPYMCIHKQTWDGDVGRCASLGPDLIVKINRGGSSIGVYPCTQDTLFATIEEAFKHDTIILVEKRLTMREISIGVLKGELSDITELVKHDPLRTYDVKYYTTTVYDTTPALAQTIRDQICKDALVLWERCDLEGYARIDFFLTEDGVLYFNELNTLPTFTKTSFFAKMWASRYTYLQLLEKILGV